MKSSEWGEGSLPSKQIVTFCLHIFMGHLCAETLFPIHVTRPTSRPGPLIPVVVKGVLHDKGPPSPPPSQALPLPFMGLLTSTDHIYDGDAGGGHAEQRCVVAVSPLQDAGCRWPHLLQAAQPVTCLPYPAWSTQQPVCPCGAGTWGRCNQ